MARGKSTTKIVSVIVISLILLAAAAITAFYFTADPVRTRTLALISFDERKVMEITDLELRYELLEIIAQYNYVYGFSTRQEMTAFWRAAVGASTRLELLKEQVVKDITDRKIALILAKESGFTLTTQEEDEQNAVFENMKRQYKDSGSDIDDYLVSTYGISFRMYRAIAGEKKIADTFKASFLNETSILDDEVLAYYEENKEKYHIVTMQHILLFTVDATNTPLSSDARNEKTELAKSLLQRLVDGENMDELVLEYSEDNTKTSNFGYYDIKAGAGFTEALENWALNSHQGDIDMIDTAYGIHIVRNHTATGLDSVFNQIISELKENRYKQMLDEKRALYDILVFDSVLTSIDPLS